MNSKVSDDINLFSENSSMESMTKTGMTCEQTCPAGPPGPPDPSGNAGKTRQEKMVYPVRKEKLELEFLA